MDTLLYIKLCSLQLVIPLDELLPEIQVGIMSHRFSTIRTIKRQFSWELTNIKKVISGYGGDINAKQD